MPDTERRFIDAAGIIWRVRERQTSGRRPALYFENDVAFRRVADYPEDWRDLPTGEREVLSLRT